MSGADLADLARAAAPPPAPPPPEPSPKPVARTLALPPGATLPRPEPVNDPKDDLVPAFDPEAPFGLGIDATGDALSLLAPEPRSMESRLDYPPQPRPDGPDQEVAAEALAAPEPPPVLVPSAPAPPAAATSRPQAPSRAGFEAEIRAAIAKAKVYPDAARERGIEGAAQLEISVARDGHLLQTKLLRSSGDPQLDAAALGAARNAMLPPAPAALPGSSFRIEVGVSFEGAHR